MRSLIVDRLRGFEFGQDFPRHLRHPIRIDSILCSSNRAADLRPMQVGLSFALTISRSTTADEFLDSMLSFALQTLEFLPSHHVIPNNATSNESDVHTVDKDFLRQNICHLCTLRIEGQQIDLKSASFVQQISESWISSSLSAELTWLNAESNEQLPAPLSDFRVIERPLPPPSSPIAPRVARSAFEPFTLDDCLDAFFSRETLGTGEMWHCPRCTKPRVASKQFSLTRLPECLIVHLKRFRTQGYYRTKLDDAVQFPQQLRLEPRYIVDSGTPRCSDFDLYGVVNHR